MTAHVNVEHTAPAIAPLRPRPDQHEHWIAHRNPVHFEEAAQLVLDAHAADGERFDVTAHDLRTWSFGGASDVMALAPIPLAGRVARIGAPPSYVRGLPAKLQMACMNFGLTHAKQPALLRLAGGEVRAIVSDRYAALDDEFVLDVIHEVLDKAGYLADARVRASAVGAHTLLRITLPGEGVAVRAGDVIEWGLDIGNSEVGLRSVQITPITYRLVCTNGMRAWKSESAIRMRHVGDPKRLHDQLRDAVPGVTKSAALFDLIADAAERLEVVVVGAIE